MNVTREAIRDDLEAQFELPEMPPPMTKRRALDFRRPCDKCELASCRCIGWKAFDNMN